MIEFTIPYPERKSEWSRRFGLNSYYSGKHWSIRKRDADYFHKIVRVALKKSHIRPVLFSSPVYMYFYFNDRLDCSNHAVYVKLIEDALKGYLIADDSRKFVKGIWVTFHNENCINVKIKAAP